MLWTALPVAGKMADFPKSVGEGAGELRFVGVGELRRWMIKGCDIAFYAPAGMDAKDALADKPRCLEFFYYRTIESAQFATAAWKTLEGAFSKKVLAANKDAIDELHRLYRDVDKGDRYRLLYVPGTGTQLFLNGKLLGGVKGSLFAEVYFSIWLGDKPLDGTLKARLLGTAR